MLWIELKKIQIIERKIIFRKKNMTKKENSENRTPKTHAKHKTMC